MRAALLALLLLSSTASALQGLAVTFYRPRASALGACETRLPGHFAVRWELKRSLPCGTRVQVILRDRKGGKKIFVATVSDLLGPAARHATDIKVNHSALLYGCTTATLRVLSKPRS
ncbi:hypothetical protein [Deinococcus hopiensis]|uniref:Uncharacterized protein n=1 Tax=Deinococcus hopiensis KR-140 TaxID=695939 RepID=A0A1W1UXA0_9DEIO|nr:hypothetical protein [Deinococcus hopiensis]SMB85649.1 hypothetical protein SAMN00790413_03490 [Deinococcus hopiensis KR-140]